MISELLIYLEEDCYSITLLSPLVVSLYLYVAAPPVCFATTRDDPILRSVKEFVGAFAVFGAIYWYTLDPGTKKAIKFAALSADVKVTKEGLEYKPFSYLPLVLVISSRAGRPSIGVHVGGVDSN